MNARRALAAACALALLLGGCTALVPAHSVPAAVRTAAPAFELNGRISASDGSQAASGMLEWLHAHGSDQWTVSSPLGQILARLQSSPAGAQLLAADGRRAHAARAQDLLPQLLGIDPPLERLAQWVQATPAADAEVRLRDRHGRPALVIDQGWRIEYPAYADDSAQAVPRRIEVSRGDARLRLLIDAWQAEP